MCFQQELIVIDLSEMSRYRQVHSVASRSFPRLRPVNSKRVLHRPVEPAPASGNAFFLRKEHALAKSTCLIPAAEGVFNAFQHFPLVGIEDWHGLAQEEDFYVQLLKDLVFPKRSAMW